jgi:altronate dehydratase small subunit
MKSRQYILVHPADNVATAIAELVPGTVLVIEETAAGERIEILQPVQFGHKFALRNIPRGQAVVKYGETIGRATAAIRAGEHVHVHNVESLRGRGDLAKA